MTACHAVVTRCAARAPDRSKHAISALVEALSAREIQRIRKQAGVSQEVFSKYLNVPATLVSQWERGEKKPLDRL
jgi:DNA-binding transcriptional regulator YiaG